MRQALKEWSIAIEALKHGETILLLRKGGIREANKRFSVPYDQALLYPTYEHQNPELLKSPYSNRVQSVLSGWHPETISVGAIADITHVFQLSDAETVNALLPFHIWNDRFVNERLNWKPRSPLYVLLLRVSTLAQPHLISNPEDYRGCRSWIELADDVDADRATPVMSDRTYGDQVEQIQQILEKVSIEVR